MPSKSIAGFLKGFAAGWAMIPSKDEQEYARAKTRYTNAQAKYYEDRAAGGTGAISPVDQARINNYNSQIKERTAAGVRAEAAAKAKADKPSAAKEKDELGAVGDDDESLLDAPPPDPDMEFSKGGAVPYSGTPVQPRPAPAPQAALPRPTFQFLAREGVRGSTSALDFSGMGVRPGGKRPKGYAAGGIVEEDAGATAGTQTADWEKQAATTPAIPTSPAPQGQPAQAQAPQPAGPGFSYTAALDAAEVGLAGRAEKYGLDKDEGVDTPDSDARAMKYHKAEGGASVEQLRDLDKVVDPNNQLSEDQRNMKKLAWVHETYLNRGDSKKAKEAATDLVETYAMIYRRGMAISKALAEKGDLDGSLKAAFRAYAYVPDGAEVKFQKTPDGRFAYKYTDQVTGKVIEKGLKTPQEMLQIVTRHGMNSFEDLVGAAAGKRYEEMQGGRLAGAIGGDPAYAGLHKDDIVAAENIKHTRASDTLNAEKEARKGAKEERERLANERLGDETKWTKDNPATPATAQDFKDLPIGAWFINPKTKEPLQKTKQMGQ